MLSNAETSKQGKSKFDWFLICSYAALFTGFSLGSGKLTIKKIISYRKRRLPSFEAPPARRNNEAELGLSCVHFLHSVFKFLRTGDRNRNLSWQWIKLKNWAGRWKLFSFENISQKPCKKFHNCILLQLSSFRFRNLNLLLNSQATPASCFLPRLCSAWA